MDRFWSKVAKAGANDCWPWLGSQQKPMGYGHWTWWDGERGRSTTAHRKAWQLTNGPIPEGMMVLHSCDNPPCCNPAHLWLGTHADNMADKVAKGRQSRLGRPVATHCKHGHEFTPETEVTFKGGFRTCRICHNARSLASYHKAREREDSL